MIYKAKNTNIAICYIMKGVTKLFKICTIGCGSIALNFHGLGIQKYIANSSQKIAWACCDIDIEKAQEFAAKFKLNAYYDNYREMLQKEQPDAVCIITTYGVIPAIAVDVMNMGFPVIMEKPPGTTGEEVIDIIKAAEQTKMPNQVAFNRRFTPVVNELKSLITDTGCDIHNIRCIFQRVGRKDPNFYTTAIHGIDTVRYLAGSDYKHVHFRYQELEDINKGAANIYMDCFMESGATAHLSFCPHSGKVIEDYHVTCLNNEFTLKMPVWGSPEYPGGLWHFSNNECVRFLDGDSPSFGSEMFEKFGFYTENANFFDDVQAKVIPTNDIRTALQSVEIADCIQQRKTEYKA